MNSINVDQDSTIGTDLENAPPAEKTVQRVTAYGVSVGDTEPGQAAKGAQTHPKFEWQQVLKWFRKTYQEPFRVEEHGMWE